MLDVVGFLPQVNRDETTSTAVCQKSPPVGLVDEGRAVRSGAQIPMITELGQFRRLRRVSHFLLYHYDDHFLCGETSLSQQTCIILTLINWAALQETTPTYSSLTKMTTTIQTRSCT